jgi:integrase
MNISISSKEIKANKHAHENQSEVGEWEVINMLTAQYHDQPINNTFDEVNQRACVFQDDTWDYSRAHKDWLKSSFLTIFPKNHSATALELIVKIIGYHLAKGHSKKEYSAKTMCGTLTDGKQAIGWLIKKNILVGSPGDYIIPSSRLTSADFNSFFDEIGTYSLTGFLGKVRLLTIWYEMSQANRLPSFMSLPFDPLHGIPAKQAWESRANLRVPTNEDEGAWPAIPLNYAFKMVNSALNLVENRRQEVNDATELYLLAKEMNPDRHTGLKILLKSKPELKDKLPSGCLVNDVLSIQPINDLLRDAQDAAIIIILSTAGLRNWEIRDLKVGCSTPDQSIRGAFRLSACIKKTSRERGKGKMVALPIPETTHSAIVLLENLRINGGEYLVEPIGTHKKGSRASIHFIDNRVSSFCTKNNVGYIPHPHQFRKTIAGWFGLHSKYATLLVMRLFSHESAAMANRYLFNNPLIKKERLEVILGAYKSLIGPLKEALLDGKLKGPMGEQLSKAIAEHPHFMGLRGDELVQTLEKLLLEKVESGQTYLLLTPLAICTTNTNTNDLPPCAITKCSDGACSVEEQIQRFNQTVPNPDKCLGAGCKRAIVTPLTKEGLSCDLKFYKSVLFNTKAEFAENILLMDKARVFVKNHEGLVDSL